MILKEETIIEGRDQEEANLTMIETIREGILIYDYRFMIGIKTKTIVEIEVSDKIII